MTNSFGKYLKNLRFKMRLPDSDKAVSLEKFSELVSIELGTPSFPSKSTINNWERDKQLPLASDRRILLTLVSVFQKYYALTSISQSNEFLNSGGYKSLSAKEGYELEDKSIASFRDDTLPTVQAEEIKDNPVSLAPPPPGLFIGRENDIQQVLSRITKQEVDSSAIQVLTTVQGWPGVGKTTLVSAIAHTGAITEFFSDGVLWIALGQNPDLFERLDVWYKALNFTNTNSSLSIEDMRMVIAGNLKDKRVLLILDDVWNKDHAQIFNLGGHKCATLITTRDWEIANQIAPTPENIFKLNVLSNDKALELLSRLAPIAVKDYPNEALELVHDLQGLPLAIRVAGRLLHEESSIGWDITNLIMELRKGSRLLQENVPSDRIASETTPTIAALLHKSVERLDPLVQRCFAALGIIAAKQATFDAEMMQAIWQVPDSTKVSHILLNRGLLDYVGGGRFQMHALLATYAKSLFRE